MVLDKRQKQIKERLASWSIFQRKDTFEFGEYRWQQWTGWKQGYDFVLEVSIILQLP